MLRNLCKTLEYLGLLRRLLWRIHPYGKLTTYSSVVTYPDLGGSAASVCMVYHHHDAVRARVTYGVLRREILRKESVPCQEVEFRISGA